MRDPKKRQAESCLKMFRSAPEVEINVNIKNNGKGGAVELAME